MPRPQKHQCLHKNTNATTTKTPMPAPQNPNAATAKTLLPAHASWPRPSAYTREFPKLTCVGIGPRPRRVCRQWGFCGRGIGVFWVQALVFLRPRHWCFWVQALVFLWSWHWCFFGRGIGVFVVAALGRVDPLRTLATGRVGGQALRFSAVQI